MLLNLKNLDLSWKDIGVIMGKDNDAVKARYKELIAAKEKTEAAADAGESAGRKSEEKKDKEGKSKEHKHKEDKSKGKENKDEEPKSILKKAAKHKEPKQGEVGSNGTPQIINVVLGGDDELSTEDVSRSVLVCLELLISSFAAEGDIPYERALQSEEVY